MKKCIRKFNFNLLSMMMGKVFHTRSIEKLEASWILNPKGRLSFILLLAEFDCTIAFDQFRCKHFEFLLTLFFRSSVRLTSSNINKLKTKIFDAGNIVEGGEGDGFSYKLEDSPPVLTLGLNSTKNLSTRRAQNAIKSRRRRSHHSRGFCGEVYEYIVQMKIYRDDV